MTCACAVAIEQTTRPRRIARSAVARSSVDYYGELLVGCIECNRWGNPGDENLVMELTEDDLEALKAISRKTGDLKEATMGTCVQCGNDYDKCFEVRMNGRTMIFDRVRHPGARACVPSLRMPHHRARRAARRYNLLLRPLRQA